MKHVDESLNQFKDNKFFSNLFEEVEELSPAEKKKMAQELEKQGMSIVKKCVTNFSKFKKFAGDIWQEYRDFWETQKSAEQTIREHGIYYNLYDSNYIVGVVEEPNGVAALKVFNTSTDDKEELIAFKTYNKNVIKAFLEFIKTDLEATLKNIIANQKAAMDAKKAADEAKQKEESKAKKNAKLTAFLSESKNK